MQLPSPISLVDLTYRPDLHVVVVRWLGATTDEETRRVYQSLAQASTGQCRFWLLDARRRPSSSPAITRWMFEDFAPQVAQQFGGPVYFSYLISPAHLAAAEVFRQSLATPHDDSQPYRLHYASQENDALAWLLQAQGTREAAS